VDDSPPLPAALVSRGNKAVHKSFLESGVRQTKFAKPAQRIG
jgi:hypothetical protein